MLEQLAKYQELSSEEIREQIVRLKEEFGSQLVILGHHYQRDEIIELSDFRGDSFKLAKLASEQEAEYIVFCGVDFMAESSAILAKPHQQVFIPDPKAGCPLADLADIDDVQQAWKELGEVLNLKEIVPITYVNSDARLKAFCGRNQGSCATSSNAVKLFKWAFEQGKKVFFFPDEHLGRNSAYQLGLTESDLAVYQPGESLAGIEPENLRQAKVILWKGYCHVHTYFQREDVELMRREYPRAKIIVHPEVPREVAELADALGSTEQIIQYVKSQPQASQVIVGTEIHLVKRLAEEEKGKREIIPLARSICPNMYKINLAKLLFTLESIKQGKDELGLKVRVPEPVKSQAKKALEKMLEFT